ncbi:hypothetical protein D7X55_34470 [Corallococcus sp. AB049A]|uniref:Uncharacterized protein n=2 Tax=Myxococcaceae TaxID=31 RepID=A0A3A8R2X7_9BACT|nr:hypothetical protein D7Y23_00005 [Corallococcus sp. AB050B]RKH71542.1 hypothetical protein D7X96_08475 [Corallococcus interemptor]RKI51283.1 hypothetical protein D7X55_34470 [Corallococcus sp. AB049A]
MTGALIALVGCGAMPEDAASEARFASVDQAQQVDNGMTLNGMTLNGMTLNGMTLNGMTLNGLATASFNDWFNQNADAAMVMAYVVKCAVPEGETRTFQSTATGTSYTWQGSLGLAPGWSSGKPATVAEQQVVSACLAAHANKYGMHIPLSALGRTASGAEVAWSAEELSLFSEKEACFFGNLFANEGLFAARDRDFSTAESSTRACGLTLKADTCAPITNIGSCAQFCTKSDPSKPYYTQCTYNGKTYPVITTRVQPVELFRCGDGVCQFTEKPGSGNTADSCRADCGA